MKSRSKLLLEKSISAILSAIEIYNKPDFKYREETFSVMCINAWELLLKARVVQLSNNKLHLLYEMEYKTLKSGKKSKKMTPKRNRSNNPMSISLFDAYRVITQDFGERLNKAIYDNLISLVEIRDNSIHFFNNDLALTLKVQELGSASLQNYLHLVSEWFGDILSGYNFYLMPLSFFRGFNEAPGVLLNPNEKNVLNYIRETERKYDDIDEIKDYNLTLIIDLKLQKVKSDNIAIPIQFSNSKNATSIILSEEDLTDKYPWDYNILCTRLSKRYSDFKRNKKYHEIRKLLESDNRYAYQRLLNPHNPESGQKTFYNANILKEFDKHYNKVKS